MNELDNLVKTGQLKREPVARTELNGLVRSGRARLADASRPGLSDEGRFDLAYNAVHALSLAALRWHGYRPAAKARYIVFQALAHTLALEPAQWRILTKCHELRNVAEYEGSFEVDARLLQSLMEVTEAVSAAIDKLGPLPKGKRS